MVGPRQVIRWTLRHGAIRWAIRRRPADDLLRLLNFDPVTIADPYPQYTALRLRGRLVAGPLALNTAHHDVTVAVLRSPDLGVIGGPGGRAPPCCGR